MQEQSTFIEKLPEWHKKNRQVGPNLSLNLRPVSHRRNQRYRKGAWNNSSSIRFFIKTQFFTLDKNTHYCLHGLKSVLDKSLLGQMSTWTTISLDKNSPSCLARDSIPSYLVYTDTQTTIVIRLRNPPCDWGQPSMEDILQYQTARNYLTQIQRTRALGGEAKNKKFDFESVEQLSSFYYRHGNNSSSTGNLEFRGNSYCEVRNTVFVLDYNIIVKELQGLSQVAVFQSVSAAC